MVFGTKSLFGFWMGGISLKLNAPIFDIETGEYSISDNESKLVYDRIQALDTGSYNTTGSSVISIYRYPYYEIIHTNSIANKIKRSPSPL